MSVSRKLFFTTATIIITLGLLFILTVQFALRDNLYFMMEAARSEEVQSLNNQLTDFYTSNGESWDGLQSFVDSHIALPSDAGLVVRSRDMHILAQSGSVDSRTIIDDGLRNVIRKGQTYVAVLYLYDHEIAEMSVWRKSSFFATLFFLVFAVIVLVALSLLLAYWVSKRLTAPLKALLQAIEQLKKGEFGVRTPVTSKDEYGKVAEAFNDMSQELLHAETVRRNLVADVAHELRTPLTIMRGKLELIQQNKQPIQPVALLPIQDELLRLSTLVEELHQLSLAEAKRLRIDKKPIHVNMWLAQVLENVKDEAALKQIQLVLKENDDQLWANLDANRMTQVLMNLLSNALRHTPEKGTIFIELAAFKKEDSFSNMNITVRDTGTGIAAEHLPHLFDRFYRADDDRSRESGGTGLGLAITKQLVEAHGGQIHVQSSPGIGTTFTINIPLDK
ncbi:sensor histidine kinase [Bacillus horti]|uniref:histidine kinase n=1 Tax=Caldalkalibacillus horti TaxID=77523 RepID=A0ABT9VZX2_9BACI|nr:ATP-binding protein [Bacillus horti]MDQ0166526.1 two-component system sensor histidine kinase BaeS [Bacillus horti]